MKKIPLLTIAGEFSLLKHFLVGGLLILLSSLFALSYSSSKISIYKQKKALKLEDNPLCFSSNQEKEKESLQIQAKAHLRDFIEFFFAYDKYDFKERMERALWLGDDSIKALYDSLESWFTTLSQHDVIQKITWQDIQTDIQLQDTLEQTWPFQLSCQLEISRSEGQGIQRKAETYFLQAKGELRKTSKDFPLNPYGFLICDFSYTSQQINK